MIRLISHLMEHGYLKSDNIIRAFQEIKRENFVPAELRGNADEDIALPIGHGQTISQPLTVAFMMEHLDPRPGQKILDVGSGSGWTTAILAHIVGEKGKVIGIERKEELKNFGEKNTEKYNFVSKGVARIVLGDGSKGYEEEAPYDRILVSASAGCVPNELKKQLKVGGRLVIPVESSIWVMKKTGENKYEKEEYPGFMFVPLVEG